MSNKMATITWFDSDTVDTVYIAAKEYGLEILARKPTEIENEIYVCIYGPIENVDRFLEDLNEGDVAPFDHTRDLTENEYQDWLSSKFSKFGFLYIPKYTKATDNLDTI